MTRQQALELLHKNMQSQNLRRHCYAVEAVMKALCKRIEGDDVAPELVEKWAISGLLHDADWEITQTDPKNHTHLVTAWIKEVEPDEEIEGAILSHGWGYVDGNPKPKTKMEWALYCSDELTGLIVACALVKPERKLSSVSLETVLGKWKQKSFAKGVNREQIEQCEGSLGIDLNEFIKIALAAMQAIAPSLGL